MGDAEDEPANGDLDPGTEADLLPDGAAAATTPSTVNLCKKTARKLRDHLTNFDQVDMALRLEPEDEDLRRLRSDLLELIMLVSKDLLGSLNKEEEKDDDKTEEDKETPMDAALHLNNSIPGTGGPAVSDPELAHEDDLTRMTSAQEDVQDQPLPKKVKVIDVIVSKIRPSSGTLNQLNPINYMDVAPAPTLECPGAGSTCDTATIPPIPPPSDSELSMSKNARKNRKYRLMKKLTKLSGSETGQPKKAKVNKHSTALKRVRICFQTCLKYGVTKSEFLQYIDKMPKSLVDCP